MISSKYQDRKPGWRNVPLILPTALLMIVLLYHYSFSAGTTRETFSSPSEAFKVMVDALESKN